MGQFGGEVELFGGEASPAPPPPLDETLLADCLSDCIDIFVIGLEQQKEQIVAHVRENTMEFNDFQEMCRISGMYTIAGNFNSLPV